MAEPKGKSVEPVEPDPKDPTPQTKPDPEVKPEDQAPEVPEGFKGKTTDDLIKEIQASQKQLGDQSKEVGELRNSLELEKQLRGLESQRVKEAGEKVAPVEKPRATFDYEKPVESVEEIIKRTLDERDGKTKQANLKQAQAEAQSYYAEGRRASMSQNSGLFKGVEREVENAVYQSYMSGIIGKHDLRNTEAWNMAAKLIHLRNGNIDRLQSDIKPVESTSTELPNPVKPGSADKPFTGLDYNDEKTRQMVKQYGLTKEEAEKIVKEEQERIMGGGK